MILLTFNNFMLPAHCNQQDHIFTIYKNKIMYLSVFVFSQPYIFAIYFTIITVSPPFYSCLISGIHNISLLFDTNFLLIKYADKLSLCYIFANLTFFLSKLTPSYIFNLITFYLEWLWMGVSMMKHYLI